MRNWGYNPYTESYNSTYQLVGARFVCFEVMNGSTTGQHEKFTSDTGLQIHRNTCFLGGPVLTG